MSIFARSCSKCKKPWQDCSFVDIRACRHGLQIAPGRSWEAMLTRCCLRRGYERSPKGLWSCLGRLLRRAGRFELAPTAIWAILGVSWAVPNESSERSKRSRRPKTTPRAMLEPTWRQLGGNLEPTWLSQLAPRWLQVGIQNGGSKISIVRQCISHFCFTCTSFCYA